MSALSGDDRRAVLAAASTAGLLIAQQVAGRALRDAFFLSNYAASALPTMIGATAVVSVAGAIVFAALLARRSPATVVAATLLVQGLLLGTEWMLADAQPRLVAAAFYVQLALLGPGVISAFWSLVNERFDPHTARRVVGTIGTGASLGGVAGGALAWLASHVFPLTALFVVLGLSSLLALATLLRLFGPRALPEDEQRAGGVFDGLRTVRRFPYLRQMAVLVALGALAEVLLDYLVKSGASATFSPGAQLGRFFGLFYGGVALVTFAIQAVAARVSLERLGLATTVALQPLAVVLTAVVGLWRPSLAAAILGRGLGGALRDSLFRSGYELLYTPLPPWQKRGSKALVDVAADKAGSLLGAGVVLALVSWKLGGERGLWGVALLAMFASVVLARRLHAGYVTALEHSLRAGLVAVEPDEVLDSTTRLTLTRTALDRSALLAEIQALHGERAPVADAPSDGPAAEADLRSGDAERIRRVLRGSRVPDPGLTPFLVPLLGRDDVFADVMRALRRAAPQATAVLLAALNDARQDVKVRSRLPRVLKACPSPATVEALLQGLDDPDLGVRKACGTVLAWMHERHPEVAIAAATLQAAVGRELERRCDDPEGQLDHVFTLLAAVGEADPLRVARWAMRGDGSPLRGTALEYLEQVLPEELHRPLLRRLGPAAVAAGAAGTRRRVDELEEELRRSATSLPRLRPARR